MEKTSAVIDELFNKDPGVKRILFPSQEELKGLDESVNQLRAKHDGNLTDPDITFEYASLLISHSRVSYIEEGVRLMESLVYAARKQNQESAGSAMSLRSPTRGTQGDPELGVVRGRVVEVASAPAEHHFEEELVECTTEEKVEEEETRGKGNPTRISHTRGGSDLVIHYYYLSIGWIKLHDYDKALTCVNQMLRIQPAHRQGIALKKYIEAEVKMTLTLSGLVGLGITAAVVAVVGVILKKA